MESTLTAVAPARPAAPYIGGKRNLAKRLVAMIEQVPHTTYAEPFVGMGGVFLRRRSRPKAEVINDISRDVWTFYRVLQEHYLAFVEMIRFHVTARAEFDRLMAVDPDTLTDMQRAARFLYLQRTAFGGKVSGRNFGIDPGRGGRFDVTQLVPILEDLRIRLAGVVVERLPWEAFIARYDREGVLFYLDPPYYGCEDDYGRDVFPRDQFLRLAEVLAGIRGHFIFSINDRPEVRATFKQFRFEEVGVTYSVSVSPTAAKELIFFNA